MIHFKHPQRCGVFGRSSWKGIIYGDGAVGLPLMPDQIYHGSFGSGLFQTIYRHNHYGLWSCLMSLEWHLAAVFLILLSTLFWPLVLLSLTMWCATAVVAARAAYRAPLPRNISSWCRLVLVYLYVMQPIWRGWYRLTYVLKNKKLPELAEQHPVAGTWIKRISASVRDLYWESHEGRGREKLLAELVSEARAAGWSGDFDNGWAEWDIKLVGDRWHDIMISTATEELGWPRRFTRARCVVEGTMFCRVLGAASLIWTGAAVASGQFWALAIAALASILVLTKIVISRSRCLRAAVNLVSRAAAVACRPDVPDDESAIPEGLSQRNDSFAGTDWDMHGAKTSRR